MKDLQIMFERDGKILKGSAINLGAWDVSIGLDKYFYIHNPNTHAKADLREIKHYDSRLQLSLPNEIMPSDTVKVGVFVPPQKFNTEEDEVQFFQDILDTLKGDILWKKP